MLSCSSSKDFKSPSHNPQFPLFFSNGNFKKQTSVAGGATADETQLELSRGEGTVIPYFSFLCGSERVELARKRKKGRFFFRVRPMGGTSQRKKGKRERVKKERKEESVNM